MFKFKSVTSKIPLRSEFIIPKPEKEVYVSKNERETALATFLLLHNVNMTIKVWGDWIEKEGPALTPYLKGVLTRMNKNITEVESVFSCKKIDQKESLRFIKKIGDYYYDTKGEFLYLFKKGYMDALNSTLPDDLFGDSFLSLMVAFHYLDNKLLLTIERSGKLEQYNRFKVALKSWVKFYKQDNIIYTEEDLKEIIGGIR